MPHKATVPESEAVRDTDGERCRFLCCLLSAVTQLKTDLETGQWWFVHRQYCGRSSHAPPNPSPGWLAPLCPGGASCVYKPQLNFLLSVTFPRPCGHRNCFLLAAPRSRNRKNAIGTEAREQGRMSDRPAASARATLLGRASVARSLPKQ